MTDRDNDDTVMITAVQETDRFPARRPDTEPVHALTPLTPQEPVAEGGVWMATAGQGPAPLTALQRSRLAALQAVKPLLTYNDFAPDPFDLMRLAEWVLTGVDLIDLPKNEKGED